MSSPNQINENELNDLLANTFTDFCKIYKKDLTNKAPKNHNNNATDEHHSDDDVSKNVQQGNGKLSSNKAVDNQSKQSDNDGQDGQDNLSPKKSVFMSLYESDSELKENWSRLVKSCGEPVDNDLHESLLDTLKVISEKAQNITSDHGDDALSDDELAKMWSNFAELNSESDSQIKDNMFELNKIMPLMSNIMENLLSKDFLYPTLSELKLKYPTYLKENRDTLLKDEYERYENQLKIILEICEEFDNQQDDESELVKKNRFNKILTLMQKMQSYGTPPSALVSNNNPAVLNELNNYSTYMNQCSIT